MHLKTLSSIEALIVQMNVKTLSFEIWHSSSGLKLFSHSAHSDNFKCINKPNSNYWWMISLATGSRAVSNFQLNLWQNFIVLWWHFWATRIHNCHHSFWVKRSFFSSVSNLESILSLSLENFPKIQFEFRLFPPCVRHHVEMNHQCRHNVFGRVSMIILWSHLIHSWSFACSVRNLRY